MTGIWARFSVMGPGVLSVTGCLAIPLAPTCRQHLQSWQANRKCLQTLPGVLLKSDHSAACMSPFLEWPWPGSAPLSSSLRTTFQPHGAVASSRPPSLTPFLVAHRPSKALSPPTLLLCGHLVPAQAGDRKQDDGPTGGVMSPKGGGSCGRILFVSTGSLFLFSL